MSQEKVVNEAERLEQLWRGDFGNKYVERNQKAGSSRAAFWRELLGSMTVGRVLEVGCNIGGNLEWISEKVPVEQVFGVDVNLEALSQLRQRTNTNGVWSPARELPFRDSWFDLVFTMGVLIHQPPQMLPLVMAEIVRCSRRYVLCGEYYSEQPVEVPYRGHDGALFKRDFGGMYQELFPELVLRQKGFLGRESGWDDVTYWLFEKR